MLKTQAVSKLKHLLIAKAHELGEQGASADEITDAVSREHPKAVEEVKVYLFKMAMGKLLSRALDSAPKSVEPTQLTMWSAFNVSPQIIIREGSKLLHKNIDACSITEVKHYAESLPKAKAKSSRRGNLDDLIAAIEPFSESDEDNVGACWKAYLRTKTERTA